MNRGLVRVFLPSERSQEVLVSCGVCKEYNCKWYVGGTGIVHIAHTYLLYRVTACITLGTGQMGLKWQQQSSLYVRAEKIEPLHPSTSAVSCVLHISGSFHVTTAAAKPDEGYTA